MAKAEAHQARERVLRRLRAHLERHHYPRLAMCAVLALAGLAGFLTSAGLLQAGLRSMAWRYGLAALVGYGIFLLGLRLWLTLHGRGRPKLEDAVDALNVIPSPGADSSAASAAETPFQFGGGGGFSGGGAGGSFDTPGIVEAASSGVIAGAAYRRLRQVPLQHWLHGAVRRTWKPVLTLTLCLVAAGLLAQWLKPAADSIGDFLRP